MTVTAIAAAAGLVALVWFLTGQGRVNSDQWASILSLPLGYVAAVVSLMVWLVRRALGAEATAPEKKPTVFQVSANRDAYTAGEMTINQGRSDTADDEELAP